MLNTLQLIEIDDPYSDLARQMFEIYKVSFPEEEREPIATIQQDLSRSLTNEPGDGMIYYALAGVLDNEVLTFVIYHYKAAYGLGYLSYIAAKGNQKGKGYGSWMFQQNLRHLAQVHEHKGGKQALLGLCWEVERPDGALTKEETGVREKRIEFYKKNEGILLSAIDFIAPPLAADLPEVPYYLMYHALAPNPGLSVKLQKTIVDFTLLECYGVTRQNKYYRHTITSIKD